MPGPELSKHLGETDHVRVEVELDAFRVIANFVVGRVGRGAAGVADSRPLDSVKTPKLGVRSPESSKGQSGRLPRSFHIGVNKEI